MGGAAADSGNKQARKVGVRTLPSSSKEVVHDESWLRAERIITRGVSFSCVTIPQFIRSARAGGFNVRRLRVAVGGEAPESNPHD